MVNEAESPCLGRNGEVRLTGLANLAQILFLEGAFDRTIQTVSVS